MAAEGFSDKLKDLPPKAWAGIALCAVLVIVIAWQWWPSGSPQAAPEAEAAAEALKRDAAAVPPTPEAPASNTPGFSRKASKIN